jgi:hypothetical protein
MKSIDVRTLQGKTARIKKVESDNMVLMIDNVEYIVYPFCRSCEYNDEILTAAINE